MGTSNFTATLCIILLSATLTSSGWYGWGNRRSHGSRQGSGHRSRSCRFLDRVECAELTNPTNGTVFYSERGFESRANYSCHNGFELLGGETRTCLSDETWSGATPTCVFTGCGTLTAPSHGDISYTGRNPGDIASIICDQGYTLTGPGNRTCLVVGWDGVSGDCVRISCPGLSSPSNGSVTQLASPVFEDVVSYSCDPGYALDGTNSRSCLSTGAWSGDDPTCVFTGCGPLSTPEHGDISIIGQLLGHTATATCDTGYVVTGTAVRTCLLSGWSGSTAGCVPVSCPALSNPAYGSVSTPDGTEFQNEAVYSCSPGFELNGDRRRCCGSTGSWSGDAPSCVQIVVCPNLPAPMDGTISVSGTQPLGSVATYTCTYGLATGDLERYCLTGGVWSGSPATCYQACPFLSAPMYGDLSLSGFSVGDTAIVTCDTGYVLNGSTVRYCTPSGWDGIEADCVPVPCPALSNPDNGSVSTVGGDQFLAEANYSCIPGFELRGCSHRSCLSTGLWSGDAPTCVETVQCPAITAPDNGTLELTGPFSLGTIATYSCDLGLVSGDRVRYCVANGTWTGTEPTCATASACRPNIALGGNVTMSSLYTSTTHGDGTWAYAVDGITDQDWYTGGCASSNREANPWLLLDLGGPFTVTALKIYNRGDGSYANRLEDLSIQFGSTTTPPEIAFYSGTFPLEDTIVFDQPYTGRYLRLSMNQTEFLTICELELYATVAVTNVALGKTVTMSSLFTSTQHGDGVWAYAVDGNTNQDWYVGGCAGTISETNPWLAIDLGDIYTVTSLKIYDRVDYDSGWLGDLSIRFGYTTSPPEIATYPGNFPVVDTIVFDMPYMGRYLIVTTNRTTYLQICELELYGCSENAENGLVGNCNDVYASISTSSGVYTVYPCGDATCPVSLYCDMTTNGGPWTVIQRRVDNSTDFLRNWTDYRDGFGDPSGNIWLGNENIHDITSQGSYELRVDLEDFEGNTAFAEYSSFSVGPESDKYRLSVSGYQSGSTAGDSLTVSGGQDHDNQQFTTQDSDNDNDPLNCANLYKGAWWYNDCHKANLNGLFLGGAFSGQNAEGVIWHSWKGYQYSLKSVMMIREII